MTCSYGWLTAAETLEELVMLADLHKSQATAGKPQRVTIKGSLDVRHPPAPPRQRRDAADRLRGAYHARTFGSGGT